MTMPWIWVAVPAFQFALLAALFWKMPDWSRAEHLFGVTVPADARDTAPVRAILARYRRRVLGLSGLLAAVTLGFVVSAAARPPLVAAISAIGITVHLLGLFAVLLAARRAALPLAVAPDSRREAAVGRADDRLPGGLVGQAGPFLIFGALMAFLAWAWPSIPERLITHWNGSFEPDGFGDKSVFLVFGIPLMGVVMCALMPPIAWSLLNRSRRVHLRGEGAVVEAERRRGVAVLLLWVEYLLAAIFVPVGLLPFAQTPAAAKALTVVVLIAAIAAPLSMLVVWLARYGSMLTRQARAAEVAGEGAPIGDRTEDRYWKAGLIYYNPDDPVLWVEKRIGVGYTFNMARPAAWWILAAMIGIPLALTVAIAVFS